MDVFFFILSVVFVIFLNYLRFKRYGGFWRSDDYYSSSNIGWNRSTSPGRISQKDKLTHRKMALTRAKMFLKHYTDLMGEHCLANENCKVSLLFDHDEKIIVGVNKKFTNNKRKMFTAKISKEFLQYYNQAPDYVVDFLWDSLCMNFDTTTMYENIISAVRAGMLDIQEIDLKTSNQGSSVQNNKVGNLNIRTNNLLNINSATEAELVALPGVNVAMAKKIIKYVEKNGNFTSFEDFVEKMKIKDTFIEKLENIVCVKAVETSPAPKSTKTAEPTPANHLDIPESDDSQNIPHSDIERIIDL